MDSNSCPSRLRSRRAELRFTVHRPASAKVSPRCHRPSGGDVACGVHVSIARPRTAGDTLEDRLALAVFRRDMPTLRTSLRRIRCWNNFKAPRGLVFQTGHRQSPPVAADLAIEAAFCATLVPGQSRVPRAERVIARTSKSSTRIVSKRRATSVVVFSTQSRRRSVSWARNRAMASFVRARR